MMARQMTHAGPNVTQLTDLVGQFLDSAEFSDFVEPGLAIPDLIPLRRSTIGLFLTANRDDRLDLCEGLPGLVAAVVMKGIMIKDNLGTSESLFKFTQEAFSSIRRVVDFQIMIFRVMTAVQVVVGVFAAELQGSSR